MIVIHKKSGNKFIVASIINVPLSENLYKLEDSCGETTLVPESAINKSFIKKIKSEHLTSVNYFEELDNIKDKVLERVNKINQVLRWTDARKNLLDKETPEYQKIEKDESKYKEDLKYFQKVLDTVKDKIVDFQSLQSRVNLEREIDLQELYAQIGLAPEKIETKDVEIIKPQKDDSRQEVEVRDTEVEELEK